MLRDTTISEYGLAIKKFFFFRNPMDLFKTAESAVS